MQRHRHIEFIRFLNAIEREVPAGKVIHTVLDNYATPAGRTAKKRDRSSRSCGGAERERLSAVYTVRSVILFGVTTTHLPARLTITSNARNVIEASRRTSVAKLLFVGSSGIYPRLAPQPIAGKLLADRPDRADD